jgi:hypothetical protein
LLAHVLFDILKRMMRMISKTGLACLRLSLVLGVMLLGFAAGPVHRAGPDMAAYAMPDGTLPQLCQTTPNGNDTGHQAHCPACHLSANIPCPNAKPAAVWALVPYLHPFGHAAQVQSKTIAAAPPQARAPPILTL